MGLGPGVGLTRGYDGAGNRTSLAADFVVGATVTRDYANSYIFDPMNRLTSVTQTAQGSGTGFHAVQVKRANFHWNLLSQPTFVTRYEAATGTGPSQPLPPVSPSPRSRGEGDWGLRGVRQANRLTGLAHRNIPTSGNAANLAVFSFAWDRMNRISSIGHSGPAGGVSDGRSTFSYDQTSQLTTADHAPPRPDENLQYDLNGNRSGAGYTTFTNNRTTASPVTPNGPAYTYTYDRNGNRASRTSTATGAVEEYTWDHRQRLTKVTFRASAGGTITQTVDYWYDLHNRLVKRRHDANGPNTAGGITDTFFAGYDGLAGGEAGINPTLEFSKANPSGNLAPSDLRHRYLWGPVVDQLLADEQLTSVTSPGNTLWPLGDHLGTLRDIADFHPGTSTFSITNHRVYDSFGNLTSETASAVDLAFGYTGKLFDEPTRLSHHWHRWYDPNLGKWLSEDPIGFSAGDANLGRYVFNAPLDSQDPTGLDDRVVGGHRFTGTGHHKIPVAVIREHLSWLPKPLLEVLDGPDNLIQLPEGSGPHNQTLHGSSEGYSRHVSDLVKEEIEAFRGELKLQPNAPIPADKQEVLVRRLISRVDEQPLDTFIGGFNSALKKGGTPEVRAWSDRLRRLGTKIEGFARGSSRALGPLNAASGITSGLVPALEDMKAVEKSGESWTWGDLWNSFWDHQLRDPPMVMPGMINPYFRGFDRPPGPDA